MTDREPAPPDGYELVSGADAVVLPRDLVWVPNIGNWFSEHFVPSWLGTPVADLVAVARPIAKAEGMKT